MASISNTPRPGYVYDSATNEWIPIGVGAHQHTNAADTPAVMPYSTYAAAGKNKIINGDFSINQRNFSSTTTNAEFNFDHWRTVYSGGTSTTSAQTFTPGAAPVSGYEGKNFYRVVVTGQSGADDFVRVQQQIESVRNLAGETITVSFFAKAASGTPKISVNMAQSFAGGDANVDTSAGVVTVSTTWARYSLTVAMPSIAGKTFGSTGLDALSIRLMLSAGANVIGAQGVGVQNNTFDIWGIQVEAGSTVTAFQTATGNPQAELAACQRYYWRAGGDALYNGIGIGSSVTTTSSVIWVPNPVTMRAIPSSVDYSTLAITDYQNYGVSVSSLSLDNASRNGCFVNTGHAASVTQYRMAYLRTNNSTSGYYGVSAEL
jgi:hypothetical protein